MSTNPDGVGGELVIGPQTPLDPRRFVVEEPVVVDDEVAPDADESLIDPVADASLVAAEPVPESPATDSLVPPPV